MKKQIDSISWYDGTAASVKDTPGIKHSFIASLATTLHHIEGFEDPTWLMGISGFAFRSSLAQNFCPSAHSIFSWKDIIPETASRLGYSYIYVSRMWDEDKFSDERRLLAQKSIIKAIENNIPSIVWDVFDAEWGLIIGYNDKSKKFTTMGNNGKLYNLPFKKLGKNGIDILSVLILESKNGIPQEEQIKDSLKAAVFHADGHEWTDRPDYENGLKALDLWIEGFENWEKIVEAGKEKNIGLDIYYFIKYNIQHLYSARYYATEYLKVLSKNHPSLTDAQIYYSQSTEKIKEIHDFFLKVNSIDIQTLGKFRDTFTEIKSSEQSAITAIKESGLL